MAEQETSTKAEEIAAAVVADLADANHAIWAAGNPGLSRDPMARFDSNTRDRIQNRLAAVIQANL